MIVLGVLPKAGAVVAAIPQPVIGGASLAMFASVAVVGIQTLSKADMRDNRNAVIVSTSVGLAMLVTLQPSIAEAMPPWLRILFGSGVTIGSLTAVVLNVVFFHIGRPTSAAVALVGGRSVTLDEVGAMGRDEFVSVFSRLHEAHTWPAERAWEHRPFASVEELRRAFEDEVLAATPDEQEALIGAYTDIVDLLLTDCGDERAGLDTASMALGEFDDHEAQELRALGAAYREKFSRPLVMCVDNLADRAQLLASGWRRVESSPAREARFALGEVIDIADARFTSLVADANPLRAAWSEGFEQLD